jgi:glycosyltransferase involved in cell wall biosynthesis
VLHLHNYRLVCAVGTCFTHGADCTRCHGRNTLPGVRLNCRGTGAEAAVYGAALALWQRRLLEHADAVVVPSAFAGERLRALGAPVGGDSGVTANVAAGGGGPRASGGSHVAANIAAGGGGPRASGDSHVAARTPAGACGPRVAAAGQPLHVVGHVMRDIAAGSTASAGRYALVVSRLAPEKGVEVAIAACAAAGLPLVVAGDGPERAALLARATGTDTRFAGHVDIAELRRLRSEAGLALVPSRSAETFGLAAAEAMAAGLPVVASAIGALPELCDPDGLVQPGDAAALAIVARARFRDAVAGEAGRQRVLKIAAPEAVAPALAAVYASVGA